ncbi:MAG: repeat protein [Acidobacteriales bacterium]|nr:repeat protein [Terriglobales bacterium]
MSESIRLKNGRVILADSVREVNGRIEYTIGENTYAIPKSSVIKIDTGGSPVVTSKDDLPSAPPKEELVIRNHEELDSRLIVSGKVDTEFLTAIEKEGNPDRAAYALILAAVHERSNGSMDQALRYLERAKNLLPESGIVLTHYASVLLQMGRPREAAPAAERAVRLSPGMASAFTALGYADYQLNKSKEAILALKKSLELQPDSSVEQMLAKIEREIAAEGQFSEETSSHFKMHYEGGQAAPQLRSQILRTLEQHFDDLSRDLNYTPHESIQVVLYNDKQYFDVTQAPTWSGAVNDGKLRMPISGITSMTQELSRILKHELTHSFTNLITKGRCPTWFNEGVAQIEEPKSAAQQGRRLASLYTTQHDIPLNQLEASFSHFSVPEAALAYAQSLISVEYIRDTYGMSDIAIILKRLGEGQSTESALRSTIHSGYGQLQQELTAYLKRTYGD